jgi:hypothetical protein
MAIDGQSAGQLCSGGSSSDGLCRTRRHLKKKMATAMRVLYKGEAEV